MSLEYLHLSPNIFFIETDFFLTPLSFLFFWGEYATIGSEIFPPNTNAALFVRAITMWKIIHQPFKDQRSCAYNNTCTRSGSAYFFSVFLGFRGKFGADILNEYLARHIIVITSVHTHTVRIKPIILTITGALFSRGHSHIL